MARILEPFFLPPVNALVVALLVLVCARRRPRLLCIGLGAAAFLLVVQMLPLFGHALMATLQVDAPLRLAAPFDGVARRPTAIVVLSAEADPTAAEFGGQSLGRTTLQRVRYGAALAKATKLPVLTTGNVPPGGSEAISESMRRSLVHEFGVEDVRWVEPRASTTWENAKFGAAMLRADGVSTIFLVTSAWHMPRARLAFEREGLHVVAAPTAFEGAAWQGPASLVPSHGGLRATTLALHELFGRLYYVLFER